MAEISKKAFIVLGDKLIPWESYKPEKQKKQMMDMEYPFYAYDLLKAGSAGYPDGWLYTELVLRYHLPWNIFIQGMMKSHLTKVEFISLGIGFYY